MKSVLQILVLLIVPIIAYSQPDQRYHLISGKSVVQTKNYYLLTLLEETAAVRAMLESDTELKKLAVSKKNHLADALKNCKNDASCYTSGMKFSAEEIGMVGNRLSALYSDKNALGKLVREHLIRSGAYILFRDLSPKDMLVKAWGQDAAGINHAIGVYAEGKKPNYPNIDSIAFKVQSRSFATLVYDVSDIVVQEEKGTLFFGPSMDYALRFLEVNERTEAADYEPMETTVNKAAVEKVKGIDWKKYKYTLILVPGAGPDTYGVALSAGGMLRCRVAALRYFEGMAPFILVSGGRVHPYKTKFSEAYEMKKYLMQELKVPESAIVMDPHARHTTTNMRNAVRLLYRYGMPVEKPCVVSTMRAQSYYITNDAFIERCRKELNHVPYKLGNRLSETEFEFYPVTDALHIDADEPLDP
ncbi:hypothetical protein DYBT9275_00563 [Dyadobacter sp. CECT 9275]|uniref:DUF218 domain-containing protein n=1 Tax=Dyadobacter helix TaxID=2822344 RepID=A0A916NAH9_9BACT|nr:YdcF family protein [Dyadobacter sp. CECT 9275]CAG4990586.1 hypothetical protein DYBT9275_00563 [Dyadobacter sp. CECT 9275]